MRIRRDAPLLLLLLVGFSLVCCGTTGEQNTPILHVTRPAINSYPAFDRMLQNTMDVQRLYKAAIALPPFPPGTVNCPLDNGIEYYLTFSRAEASFQQMTLDATGCQILHIPLSSSPVRRTTREFQSLFLKAVGISSLVPGVS